MLIYVDIFEVWFSGACMIFKLTKINTAPEKSGLISYEVNIQVAQHFSRNGERLLLGSSCQSQEELNEQVDRLIRELKKLKFPA